MRGQQVEGGERQVAEDTKQHDDRRQAKNDPSSRAPLADYLTSPGMHPGSQAPSHDEWYAAKEKHVGGRRPDNVAVEQGV
jgi:hypothetical protein